MTKQIPSAAILIIGNEILSGRTQDTNTQFIAAKLTSLGIRMREVRVVPDEKDLIIKAVNELRGQVDYLFTTGGIGPTHDDITAGSIAGAFGVELLPNTEARQQLLDYYGSEAELNEGRLRMALIPKGATLIRNPVSGAPGFIMENVYTMAGVPRIMQAMMDNIAVTLRQGPKIISNTVSCSLGESAIAKKLEEIQSRYETVEIGSYPHYRAGKLGLSLVLRSTDQAKLDEATEEVMAMVNAINGNPVLLTG